MIFSFHPEAVVELNQAVEYYEDCAKGLGLDFAIEINSTIERILSHPQAWAILKDDVRRCLVRRFPYGILYSIESEEILILAVMNQHKEPEYWKNRI